jgi:hypothetical protein
LYASQSEQEPPKYSSSTNNPSQLKEGRKRKKSLCASIHKI